MTSEAIHAEVHRLQAFYIQAYHIKDALIAEADSTKISEKAVEDAINDTPVLSLLADLCNLDKHQELEKPPRSGSVPVIESVRATSRTGDVGGWRLELVIEHKGKRLDGLNVASEALGAWRKHLKAWNLI